MFIPSVPIWEIVVRTVIVYVAVLLLLRLAGKRELGQMSVADLVVILVIANAVQNAMNGGDNSVIGGIVSAVTLVAANWFVGLLTYRNKKMETLIEGRPEVLIHNGNLFGAALQHAKLTRHELMNALREAGCASIEDVHAALLENDGTISVIPKKT